MESLKIWYDTLKNLDTSIDNVSMLDESVKQEDIVKMYNDKTVEMFKKGNEIQPLEMLKMKE